VKQRVMICGGGGAGEDFLQHSGSFWDLQLMYVIETIISLTPQIQRQRTSHAAYTITTKA